jgi:hypothetical protein
VVHYLDWWLENVAPETVSPDTLVDYRWQLEHYVIPHIGHIRLAKLTPADVQMMLRSLEKAGYSPRTRQGRPGHPATGALVGRGDRRHRDAQRGGAGRRTE